MPRHFIDVPDILQQEMKEVLARAKVIDDQLADNIRYEGTHLLDGRLVGFVNAMESARTGGSIAAATAFHRGVVKEFGKDAHRTETGAVRESALDLLKTAIALRCKIVFGRIPKQQDLVEAKRCADQDNVSIINALTAGKAHPLQALADIYGFERSWNKRGMDVPRPKIVFSGRGDNNVTISQAKAAAMMGWHWVHTVRRTISASRQKRWKRSSNLHGDTKARWILKPIHIKRWRVRMAFTPMYPSRWGKRMISA